jgi:hypothetical protein
MSIVEEIATIKKEAQLKLEQDCDSVYERIKEDILKKVRKDPHLTNLRINVLDYMEPSQYKLYIGYLLDKLAKFCPITDEYGGVTLTL